MFEWFNEFWRWIGYMHYSGKMYEPYKLIGEHLFTIIVVVMVFLYAFFAFRMWNWPLIIKEKLGLG